MLLHLRLVKLQALQEPFHGRNANAIEHERMRREIRKCRSGLARAAADVHNAPPKLERDVDCKLRRDTMLKDGFAEWGTKRGSARLSTMVFIYERACVLFFFHRYDFRSILRTPASTLRLRHGHHRLSGSSSRYCKQLRTQW